MHLMVNGTPALGCVVDEFETECTLVASPENLKDLEGPVEIPAHSTLAIEANVGSQGGSPAADALFALRLTAR